VRDLIGSDGMSAPAFVETSDIDETMQTITLYLYIIIRGFGENASSHYA